jgi:hypothetical protein
MIKIENPYTCRAFPIILFTHFRRGGSYFESGVVIWVWMPDYKQRPSFFFVVSYRMQLRSCFKTTHGSSPLRLTLTHPRIHAPTPIYRYKIVKHRLGLTDNGKMANEVIDMVICMIPEIKMIRCPSILSFIASYGRMVLLVGGW